MPKLTYFVENGEANTLSHYGRLGMKWGQHIFGRDKMGSKVVNRLGKYEKKADKYLKKRTKYERKLARSARLPIITDFGVGRYEKRLKRTLKYTSKYTRTVVKGKKFASNANTVFGLDPVSGLSAEQIAIGERFALQFVKKG